LNFGKKSKEKEAEARKRNEIPMHVFEQHCYDVVKRVNQNSTLEAKFLKKKIDQIG